MADYSLAYELTRTEAHQGLSLTFFCFDTWCSLAVYGCPDAETLLLELREVCLRFHRLWSFADPCSDVARLNGTAREVEVAPETAQLLRAMLTFHAVEPAFDFTIGPVSHLWKQTDEMPTEHELAEALKHVEASGVHVKGTTVRKEDPQAMIDVGGSAKGFVADALADRLRRSGVACADIDLGGNLYLLGQHPHGRPWRVDVDLPDGFPCAPPRLEVADASIVTSSSFERSRIIGGMRCNHIIDPRTGWPSASDVASATVVHASSLQADLLATTAVLAGSAGLEALAARHPEARFTLVLEDGMTLTRP